MSKRKNGTNRAAERLGLNHMDGETAAKENTPREWQLPLRRLTNQSITEYQKMEEKSMGDDLRDYAIPNFNSVGQITISTDEYRYLIKTWAASEVFKSFVKRSEYSIDREDCARFLGFNLEDAKEES